MSQKVIIFFENEKNQFDPVKLYFSKFSKKKV